MLFPNSPDTELKIYVSADTWSSSLNRTCCVICGWPVKHSLLWKAKTGSRIFSFSTRVWTRWHLRSLSSIWHVCSWGKRVSFLKLLYKTFTVLPCVSNVHLRSFILFQLTQMTSNSPCLFIKKDILYQLILGTMWLCAVSMKVTMWQGFTGISYIWERNQSSFALSQWTIKPCLMMNSRVIHDSQWILKKEKLT